ncbi:hypothetical protein [Streptomyces prunicolor]|uniref:hypothetical protein n=1 Tax=Streptomyces prunicolor TaxID=67348 RepID=UPI0033D60F24
MPDALPVNFDRATALGIAQHWAFSHAHEAQDRYEQAEALRARAEETGVGGALPAEAYALANRSRVMAETWSHVATALATPATADDQPAIYELHVAIDPTNVPQALRRAAAADGHGTSSL